MFKNKVQRYSIRKLTVGAASVLIGMAFLANGNQAKADTAEGQTSDGQDNTKAVEKSNKAIDQTPAQDIKQVVVEKTNEQTDHTAAGNTTQNKDQSVIPAKEKVNAPDPAKSLSESKAQTKDTQQVAKPADQSKDSTTDPKQVTHKVTINFVDDTTGKPILKLNRSKWAYEYVNTLTGEFKDGDAIEFTHPAVDAKGNPYTAVTRPSDYELVPGYKLINEDEINKTFPTKNKWGVPIMTGDTDITLIYRYAPLADTLIKYVDEDSGATLATIIFPNSRLNVESNAHKMGAVGGVDAAKYEAAAINIPGYRLVSAPLIEGKIKDTEIKLKDNPNPTVLVFKYKKVTPNEVPQDIDLNNNAGSKGNGVQLSTNAWASMPGMFTITRDPKTGKSITIDGRKVQEATKDLIDRYTKQGFTYAGTSGKIFDDDVYDDLSDGTSIHLLPNQPITVKYVDENGNELAKADTIEFNKNNPDQTNNGINPDKYWHPEGKWTTSAKKIAGYDHVKTIGAEKGNFTLFKYTVTYVYGKHVQGKITYIDDTTNKDLRTDNFEGTAGKKINYTTADKIANYEKQGYKLVSNNFSDGNQVFQENGNIFTVHLTKDQTPTPQPSNPTTTPTPSNPTQPTETVIPHPETPDTPQTPSEPSNNNETVIPHPINVPEDNSDNTEETIRPHAAVVEKQATVKAQAELPQTGENQDNTAAAAGLAMFGIISTIGLAGSRKHEN